MGERLKRQETIKQKVGVCLAGWRGTQYSLPQGLGSEGIRGGGVLCALHKHGAAVLTTHPSLAQGSA